MLLAGPFTGRSDFYAFPPGNSHFNKQLGRQNNRLGIDTRLSRAVAGGLGEGGVNQLDDSRLTACTFSAAIATTSYFRDYDDTVSMELFFLLLSINYRIVRSRLSEVFWRITVSLLT